MSAMSAITPPVLLPGWLPPNRANWELLVWLFQFFPIVCLRLFTTVLSSHEVSTDWLQFTTAQWCLDWYGMGKTSVRSRLNLNGRLGWILMEVPGLLCAWYCVLTIPPNLPGFSAATQNSLEFQIPKTGSFLDIPETWSNLGGKVVPPAMQWWDLPVGNKTLLGLYTIHYVYRALIFPFLNPSMSPIHLFVFLAASTWQTLNGLSIGGWIAGYGKSSTMEWAGRPASTMIGLIIWGWALLGNMFHDDELREIRREAARQQRQEKDKNAKKNNADGAAANNKADVGKVYMLPQGGLFSLVLHPHYLCEWIEWLGFCIVGGWDFTPGRIFLVNEITTMTPRALAGWRWYVGNFGREKIGKRKAVIPYLL
ncbi:MAG: hypothetical protein Q9162_007721 [Coniocarpon cinnabarinum]